MTRWAMDSKTRYKYKFQYDRYKETHVLYYTLEWIYLHIHCSRWGSSLFADLLVPFLPVFSLANSIAIA